MHLYKTAEWEDAAGNWLVNDTTSMTSIAIKWWVPMRMLNLTPEDYIHLLKDKFHILKTRICLFFLLQLKKLQENIRIG